MTRSSLRFPQRQERSQAISGFSEITGWGVAMAGMLNSCSVSSATCPAFPNRFQDRREAPRPRDRCGEQLSLISGGFLWVSLLRYSQEISRQLTNDDS